MWPAAQSADLREPVSQPRLFAHYNVLGIPIAIASDVQTVLQRVDDTYAAFRQSASTPPAFTAELLYSPSDDRPHAVVVCDSQGQRQEWPDEQAGLLDLLARIVYGVLAELHRRGIYTIHAGALVDRGAALIIAGRTGQGKTTLTLGLIERGLGLLSDEFAVIDPAAQLLLPYRRSVHIRPGTPELIPKLHFLRDQPQHQYGVGVKWSLTPAALERAFPGCLAPAAPLRHVLLLDGAPQPGARPTITAVPPALAAIELLRGTWAASRDFAGGLARLGRLMDGVACARLRMGEFEPTLDAIAGWLETHHDRV